MSEHTKAPWEVVAEIDGQPTLTRIKAAGRAVATTAPQCGRPHHHAEAAANAILIAASPELLEKLRWNLSWLRAALDCKAWEWDWDQREVAEQDYAEGMALVAKAGVQP